VTKTQKAIRIIEAAMKAGVPNHQAASEAERQTGLSVISDGPSICYRWTFFVLTRDGRRVLRYHHVLKTQ
jgi:hypothetical protein